MTIGRMLLLGWLALVWVLLWGAASPLVLASAAVVAPLCLAACRLPRVPPTDHPVWRRVPGTAARFAVDMVASSLQVAWATLRHGPRTTSAVIAVPAPARSEAAVTLVANRLSLEPGTLVLEIDHDAGLLYVYTLDVRQPRDADDERERARRVVADVLRTLGSGPVNREGERR